MPYQMDAKIANKVFSIAVGSNPDFARKNEGKPQKILEEYIASFGFARFISNLKGDKEVVKEIGNLLKSTAKFDEWPDWELPNGSLVLCEEHKLLDWIITSVVSSLEANKTI